jgi:hypothetical protein
VTHEKFKTTQLSFIGHLRTTLSQQMTRSYSDKLIVCQLSCSLRQPSSIKSLHTPLTSYDFLGNHMTPPSPLLVSLTIVEQY